jgi:transcriptional regulator with XRE-family HTH domain
MPRTAASEIHAKVVGREIRATRNALGLTQSEVAERLGASASYISAVEAGRRNLTLGQLANIANAMRLGVNISFVRPDGKPVVGQPTGTAASIDAPLHPRRQQEAETPPVIGREASARNLAGLPVLVHRSDLSVCAAQLLMPLRSSAASGSRTTRRAAPRRPKLKTRGPA